MHIIYLFRRTLSVVSHYFTRTMLTTGCRRRMYYVAYLYVHMYHWCIKYTYRNILFGIIYEKETIPLSLATFVFICTLRPSGILLPYKLQMQTSPLCMVGVLRTYTAPLTIIQWIMWVCSFPSFLSNIATGWKLSGNQIKRNKCKLKWAVKKFNFVECQ